MEHGAPNSLTWSHRICTNIDGTPYYWWVNPHNNVSTKYHWRNQRMRTQHLSFRSFCHLWWQTNSFPGSQWIWLDVGQRFAWHVRGHVLRLTVSKSTLYMQRSSSSWTAVYSREQLWTIVNIAIDIVSTIYVKVEICLLCVIAASVFLDLDNRSMWWALVRELISGELWWNIP